MRTRERATKRPLEMECDVGKIERVAIVHTNAPTCVAELRIQAADLLPGENIMVRDITPVIGGYIGPGVFGFAVIGAHES